MNESELRSQQWAQDRATEGSPLPFADEIHYTREVNKDLDLAAAERSNIARAAGELGLTTVEWEQMRKDLGRSPSRGDISR